jgi:hypothetical protein
VILPPLVFPELSDKMLCLCQAGEIEITKTMGKFWFL